MINRMKMFLVVAMLGSYFVVSSQENNILLFPSKCGFVQTYFPDSSFSPGDPDFIASAWTFNGNPYTDRSLMQFDFSSIPSNAIVDSALLSLYWYQSSSNIGHSTLSGSNQALLQRLTSSWNINMLTWNNQPSSSVTNEIILPISTNDTENYLNINVLPLVNDMLTLGNNGFVFRLETENYYRAMLFASSYIPDSALKPRLVIKYHVPCPVISLTINPSSNPSFCQGDSITLTSSQAPYYLWNDVHNSTTQSITVHTTNNYSVTVTDSNGCTASATIFVLVNPAPMPIVSTLGNTVICQGDSVILTSSNDSALVWNNGDTTQNITVYTSGNYFVTQTDSLGCTGVSAPYYIEVMPRPQAHFSTIDTVGCTPYAVTFINTSSNATNYRWKFGDTQQSLLQNPVHTYHNAGIYTVTLIIDNDTSVCPADTFTINNYITVNQSPATPVITANGPLAFCAGDSVQLTTDTAAMYHWNTAATSQSIVVDNTGSYRVTITSGNGCTAVSTPINIEVGAQPFIIPNGSLILCQGDSVTLMVNNLDSLFLWNTGATTQEITVDTSGSYTVTVTMNVGCQRTLTETVIVNPLPTPIITSSSSIPFCNGLNDTLTCLPSGSAYLWNNAATAQDIIITTYGNFVVELTDSNGCSASSDTIHVITYPLPMPVIQSNGPTSFCAGLSDTLLCTPFGISYLWNNGATTQRIGVDTSGIFYVTLIDSNGCVGISAADTITEYPLPMPIIIQHGDTLSTAVYSHYQWQDFSSNMPGDTNQSLIITVNGCYKVMVIDNYGCMGVSDSICFSTGINQVGNNEGFDIYPNPNHGIFTVYDLGFTKDPMQIKIFDVMGQMIYEDIVPNTSGKISKDIDLGSRAMGVYYIKLIVGDKTYTKRIIVI